ncbi:hypothetical protein BDV25DRAFT_97418 [Aspergillus avenaceus]|uniref:GAR domain-containing protein n=1 Tax=Aspergillus avenaceus TaxID=36643 RepID=A0A5N6TYV4_ASPAV|nr:hypothetical protein BDV25DRAFT_97418 [Aspergillus avenaceus]
MATSRNTPIPPPIHLPAAVPNPHVVSPIPSPCRPMLPCYQSLDPLLGSLSPESTLEALTSTDAVPKNEPAHDILAKSISQVSQAERALGIRAAVAAQSLSLWYKEVQAWGWPKRADAETGKGFVPPTAETSEPEYFGSLPAVVVAQYEKRIEEIRDGMDSLGVDELKEHVLNAHIPSRSRPSSANSNLSLPPPLSYVQLSDFTAVVTATILRALPLLSRLNSLLATWNVRLLVLRQVPGLLRSLRLAQSELLSALDLLKSPTTPGEHDALYSRDSYHARRTALEATVLTAGRHMDRMLDALEGREDSLPESWIDELEAMESSFGTWVMDAEKRTVENEWRRMMYSKPKPTDHVSLQTQPAHSPDEIRDTPDVTHRSPEPFPQSVRPPLMETIDEEPGTPVEGPDPLDTKLDQNATVSQAHEAGPSSHGSDVSSSDSTGTTNSEASEVQGYDGVTEVVMTPEKSVTETVIHNLSPLSAKSQWKLALASSEGSPREPVHVEDSKETTCNCQGEAPKALLADASHDSVQNNIESAQGLQKQTDDPFVSEVDGLIEAESPKEISPSSGNVSPTPLPASPGSEAEVESVIVRVPRGATPDMEETPDSDGAQALGVSTSPESVERVSAPVQLFPVEDKAATLPSLAVVPSPTDVAASMAAHPDGSLPPQSGNSPDSYRPPSSMEKEEPAARSPRQPLDSPIKLSSTRPGRLHQEDNTKSRDRRTSGASAGSSDYPSLVSSPEVRGLRTVSSNGTPKLIETPPLFHADYPHPGPVPTGHDHTLREDRLLRLESEKTPPTSLKHNRALSLPLQRFINERLDLDYEDASPTDMPIPTVDKKVAVAPVSTNARNAQRPTSRSSKHRYSAPANGMRRNLAQHAEVRGGETVSTGSDAASKKLSKPWDRNKNKRAASYTSPLSEPPVLSTTARLRKQLIAHHSPDSIGSSGNAGDTFTGTTNERTNSRPSTPGSQIRRPKDHLDEKISSILTTIPTRIHLMSAEERELEASMTSLPLKAIERFRSVSPQGTPRSGTPTPSLTLTPAVSRRRYSHAPEESSVKLYHLHQGGKSAPTKLFVRSVGENGERVMVRVGGGWADLAEYLREYAIHHGRRHVSDTPRVEVQGLSSRESTPTYTPPGGKPPRSGRITPSRPQSVISNRPSSSLAVRKTRRASNVSDMTDLRAPSASETMNLSSSPMSTVSSRRRLSTSSNTSFGAASCVSDARYSAIPLGLAGPKPRSRNTPMSAESEAWVEDVLGQARRSSSLRPFTYGLSPPEHDELDERPPLPKSRSISDIGKAGSSKRVVLRGLGNR